MNPSTPTNRSRILIVDDHPAVCEALALRIDRQPDMVVCGEAADMPEALKMFTEEHPDVVVADVSLRSGDGIELTRRIKDRDPRARVLVWSMHSESLYAQRAIRAGAMGYISKDQATERIIEAIRTVLAGKVWLSPDASFRLLQRAVGAESAAQRSPIEGLADRELEVFRLIGEGLRTGEIAQRMHLSVKTVETYRDRIRKKLDLPDGARLADAARAWVLDNS